LVITNWWIEGGALLFRIINISNGLYIGGSEVIVGLCGNNP
jgi:hypothetical protein